MYSNKRTDKTEKERNKEARRNNTHPRSISIFTPDVDESFQVRSFQYSDHITIAN